MSTINHMPPATPLSCFIRILIARILNRASVPKLTTCAGLKTRISQQVFLSYSISNYIKKIINFTITYFCSRLSFIIIFVIRTYSLSIRITTEYDKVIYLLLILERNQFIKMEDNIKSYLKLLFNKKELIH